ncbi:uncharacterized protein [Vicugna pacos]|uniref:Uncharacterized protein n=1 Tax=Vicugna pacos TaxID=30538 RepID=A0ABM5DJX9_VICPA
MPASIRRSAAVRSVKKASPIPPQKHHNTNNRHGVLIPYSSPSGKGESEGADALGQVLVRRSPTTRLRMNLQPAEPRGTFKRALGAGPGGSEEAREGAKFPVRLGKKTLRRAGHGGSESGSSGSGEWDRARRHAVPRARARPDRTRLSAGIPRPAPRAPTPRQLRNAFSVRERFLISPSILTSDPQPPRNPVTPCLPPRSPARPPTGAAGDPNQPYLPQTLLSLSLCPISFQRERKGMRAVGERRGYPGHRRDLL